MERSNRTGAPVNALAVARRFISLLRCRGGHGRRACFLRRLLSGAIAAEHARRFLGGQCARTDSLEGHVAVFDAGDGFEF